MKKTLTVNLGGRVFHIDEDAYQLLDKYLTNLRIHLRKEEGAEEILSDFELRISEMLNERIRLGNEVITIAHVENVITRMGKVEELFGEDLSADPDQQQSAKSQGGAHKKERVSKRFFRNPDDRVLGGVAGGFAAYMDWDPTPIRIGLFLLVFAYGITIPIYCILWLITPMAYTASEKLQMRGESVTVENIGKTVTDGFRKVSSSVNDYINSDRPRTALQRFGDTFVNILGVLMKIAVIIVGLILVPPLLLVLFIMIIVIVALIFGGGAGLLYHIMPSTDWNWISGYPDYLVAIGSISTILLIGIPILTVIYAICSQIFKYKPLPNGVKWALLIIWVISLLVSIYLSVRYGIPFWRDGHHVGLGWKWD
ncbi:MAG: PspC domain-containing protein [Tannerellaceae bacterium]|jgi:phage shock protein PspC (stress-responsive transcriptional regulator)|nr:PspC domain-containing protein [Tannerellaceae bacterium]